MKKPRRSGALDGYGVWWLITSTPPTHNGFSDVADSLDGMGGDLSRNLRAIFYAVAAAASTPGQSAANSASDTTALTSNSMPKPLIQGPR